MELSLYANAEPIRLGLAAIEPVEREALRKSIGCAETGVPEVPDQACVEKWEPVNHCFCAFDVAFDESWHTNPGAQMHRGASEGLTNKSEPIYIYISEGKADA